MHFRWRRLPEDDRQGVWSLYGWFCGLICFGSLFGTVVAGTFMHSRTFLYRVPGIMTKIDGLDKSDLNFLKDLARLLAELAWSTAEFQKGNAAYVVAYVIEFNFACLAKLIVLDRLVDFGARQVNILTRRLSILGRCVIVTVLVCNIAGLCSNISTAVLSIQASNLNVDGSILFNQVLNDDTLDEHQILDLVGNFEKLFDKADDKYKEAQVATSVQAFLEVFAVSLIILSFLFVGVYSVRRVNAWLRSGNDGALGRHLRMQIVVTIVCLFLTLLLRSFLSFMVALVDYNLRTSAQNIYSNNANCTSYKNTFCDPNCNSENDLVQTWLDFTPQVNMIFFLISSPLALLVALWGMTSKRMRRRMHSSKWTVSLLGTIKPHAHQEARRG